jgi:two-component system chemotaxis response regulator CheB
MTSKHLVVIGASAGGIDALRELAKRLPPDFPAPICVVLHTAPQSPGVLSDIVNRAGPLRAVTARPLQRLSTGVIHFAPPDHHIVVEPGRLRVTRGPKENRFRPAIDPLFRSAAQVYGPGAIGVILTGSLDDGTAGLWAIKKLGGVAIVQDPDEALFPAMPENARACVAVDFVLPLAGIAEVLARLVATPVHEMRDLVVPRHLAVEINIAKEQNAMDAGIEHIATPSPYSCPECHGVLLQLKEEGRLRFRCHTGHAYSPESLIAAVNEGMEASLWEAIRALEEGAMLMERFAEHARAHPNGDAASKRFVARARSAHAQAQSIHELLVAQEPLRTGTDST